MYTRSIQSVFEVLLFYAASKLVLYSYFKNWVVVIIMMQPITLLLYYLDRYASCWHYHFKKTISPNKVLFLSSFPHTLRARV